MVSSWHTVNGRWVMVVSSRAAHLCHLHAFGDNEKHAGLRGDSTNLASAVTNIVVSRSIASSVRSLTIADNLKTAARDACGRAATPAQLDCIASIAVAVTVKRLQTFSTWDQKRA